MKTTAGRFNVSELDTTPSCSTACPFSPPADWSGDDDAYRALILERYKSDSECYMLLLSYARWARPWTLISMSGPWSGVARNIIERLCRS